MPQPAEPLAQPLVPDDYETGDYLFAKVQDLVGGMAEGQSLENVARPLTAIEEGTGTSAAAKA